MSKIATTSRVLEKSTGFLGKVTQGFANILGSVSSEFIILILFLVFIFGMYFYSVSQRNKYLKWKRKMR